MQENHLNFSLANVLLDEFNKISKKLQTGSQIEPKQLA